MRRSLVHISSALALILAFSAAQLGAQEPDYILSVSSSPGVVGGTVELTVSLTVNGLEVSEYELNICDGPLVEIASVDDVVLGAGIESLLFESHEITFGDDRWSVAAMLDATENVLAGVATYELYRATYTLSEEGTTDITFCDAKGTNTMNGEVPALENGTIEASAVVFLRGDVNGDGMVVPLADARHLLDWGFGGGLAPPCRAAADVSDNGSINALIDSLFLLGWALSDGDEPPDPGPYKCGPDPTGPPLPCATLTDPCSVEFDPVPDADYTLSVSSAIASIKSVFTVRITLDSTNGEALSGLQFSLCHDEDLLATEPGNLIFGDGYPEMPTGPGYHSTRFFDEGWTVGILFELIPEDGLQIDPGDDTELYVVYYNTLETPGTTALEFCALGDPPVQPLVLTLDAEFVVPETTGGTIEIIEANIFKRGDCNGNGTLDPLPDAIFILRYGFLGGDAPACLDAADFDDNGVVNALTDGLQLLNYGFLGGEAPPDPGPDRCGIDPTQDKATCLGTGAGCL